MLGVGQDKPTVYWMSKLAYIKMIVLGQRGDFEKGWAITSNPGALWLFPPPLIVTVVKLYPTASGRYVLRNPYAHVDITKCLPHDKRKNI